MIDIVDNKTFEQKMKDNAVRAIQAMMDEIGDQLRPKEIGVIHAYMGRMGVTKK